MSDPGTIVVVGAGLAGAKAVEALRQEGFAGRLVLIGAEEHRPYERPPLSKGYLQGGEGFGSEGFENAYVHPQEWYAEHDVDLRLDCVVAALDRGAHEVVLSDQTRVGYDKLLITTGAVPRRLTVPGADLDGVHYLRTREDSDALKAAFGSGVRVAIIGGGWIGLETAAAARGAGCEVVILEYAELPLLRVLGSEIAPVFADLHREHGVDLRCGVEVTAFRPTADDSASAGAVRLGDGTEVAADLVIVGVGISPAVALAESAGLTLDNGILVDEHLRTSDPDIFAAGDVANAYHPFLAKHVRVEHWANALNQPAVAAASMLGQDASYDRLPYFFSDQYDLGMEYSGYAEPGAYDDVVVRGDLAAREFVAFWLSEGRVLAGMNVNVWDVTDPIQALIRSRAPVDVQRLANPDVPLTELLSR